MGKPKLPNYTRDQADLAVSTLLRLGEAIRAHEAYRNVYEESYVETRGRAERFKTLERKEEAVSECMTECRNIAETLRIEVDDLKRRGF